MRRRGRPGPEGPGRCQAGRHIGRRLEEADRRQLIRSSTRPSRWMTSISKKDYKGAISEYKAELMLYPTEPTKPGLGLVDTLNWPKPMRSRDTEGSGQRGLVLCPRLELCSCRLQAPDRKAKLEYWYKKYHGALDGLDDGQGAGSGHALPAGNPVITPAPTPAEQIHDMLARHPTGIHWRLATRKWFWRIGTKEDADKLWALLKDQAHAGSGNRD